ncbi:MAG: MFS transporter [Thermoleophilia bacterium]
MRGAVRLRAPLDGRQALLGAIGSGTLLNALNSSMIAVALVSLQRDFGLRFDTVSWVVSVFYLASASGQPVMGRLSDVLGPRRVFRVGLVISAAAATAAPFAPDFGWLLGLRALQAIGTSALFPSGVAIVRATIHDRQARALGVLALFSSMAAALGPTLGALLVSAGGWQAIFWANLPIVALSSALAARFLPPDPPVPPARPLAVVRRVDPLGVALFVAALVALLWFLLSLGRGADYAALAIGLGALAAFVAAELRAREPFVDLRELVANRALSTVYVRYVLVNVVFYCVFLGFPSYLEESRDLSLKAAGLVMLAVTGVGIVTVPAAGRLIDRRGPTPALVAGFAIMTAGSALMLTLGDGSPVWWIVVVLAALGASSGFSNLGLQATLVRASRPDAIGTASGLFMTARYLGSILAACVLGIAFGDSIDRDAQHRIALLMTVLSGIVLVSALPLRLAPRGRAPRPPAGGAR